jgi:hypothetical protein
MTTVNIVRMIEIAGEAEDVWALICDPDAAVLLNERVVRCSRDPSTPRGQVGERHTSTVLVPPTGRLIEMTTEVIEIEPCQRVVTATVPDDGSRTTYLLTGHANRTMLAIRYEASPSWFSAKMLRPAVTSTFDHFLGRVRDVIEDGWQPESG